MNKKKRIFSTAAALSLAGLMMFSSVGCQLLPWTSSGGGSTSGGGSSTIVDEDDPYVEELVIVTQPTKTSYRLYETFDSAGMTLVAKWSHGVDEDLHPAECKISTKLITADVDKITLEYEGKTAELPLTVDKTEIKSVTFDSSSVDGIQLLGALDLSKVVAKIKYADGETRTSTDLTITENGTAIKKPAAYMLKEVGIHEYEMTLGEYSGHFDVMAQTGTAFRAKRGGLIATEDMAEYVESNPDTNFVEKVAGGAGYIDSQGLLYIGGTGKGSVLRFHIYSEEAKRAEFMLTAASSLIMEGLSDWTPTRIDDMNVNEQVEVYQVTTTDGEETKTRLTVDDSVVFPGITSDEPDMMLWLNFADISLGEIDFVEGENIIELNIVSNAVNMFGSNCAINVLGYKVLDREVNCEHELEQVKGVAGKCCEYSVLDYWRCKHCLRTYSDENGEERVYNAPLKTYVDHIPGAPATCKEPQKCTVCGEALSGLGQHNYDKNTCEEDGTCLTCGKVIPAGHDVGDDGHVRSCSRCSEELGFYYDVSERDYINYYTADGTAWNPAISGSNKAEGDAPLHLINYIGGLDNKKWKGGTMQIKVNVKEAGTYGLKFRFQSVGGCGKAIQNVSQIFEYTVNPTGDASGWTYTDGQGQVQPATVTKDWSDFWYWSVVNIGNINLVEGDNLIVVRFKASFSTGGPNVGGVLIEKEGYEYFGESTIVSTRKAGTTFNLDEAVMTTATGNAELSCISGLFLRVAVPTDQRASFGSDYYDFIITADMLSEAIDTSTAGQKSVTVTATKFGKTYTATLNYTVAEAA